MSLGKTCIPKILFSGGIGIGSMWQIVFETFVIQVKRDGAVEISENTPWT